MANLLRSLARLGGLMLVLMAVHSSAFAAAKKPLVVFLIHGLGGNETTFGDLPDMIRAELGQELIVQKLLYNTESPTETPRMFVDQIAIQMANTFRQSGLDPKRDPFALVGHSQGGIVARSYISNCILFDDCKAPGLPKNAVLLFTMGTPHWGSPLANKMSSGSITGKVVGWAGGARYEQNKQLAIGSTSMYTERSSVLKLSRLVMSVL